MLSIFALEASYLIAISFVWSRGTIFRSLRTLSWETEAFRQLPLSRAWIALADCPLCSGFWIGVFGHALWLDSPVLITWLGIGSIVGTCALGLCAIVRRL